MAVVTLAQVRARHALLEAFTVLLLAPRLAAVAAFETGGGRRHCILVVGSGFFNLNFLSKGQRIPLQDALLGFRADSCKLGEVVAADTTTLGAAIPASGEAFAVKFETLGFATIARLML